MTINTNRIGKLFIANKKTAGGVVNQTNRTLEKAQEDFHKVYKHEEPAAAPSSARLNPFYTQENDKYLAMDKIRDRIIAALRTTTFHEIEKVFEPVLIALGILNPKLIPTLTASAVRALPSKNDIADCILKMGPLPQNGWTLEEQAEGFARLAKHYSLHTETSILMEAPTIYTLAPTNVVQAHFNQTVACNNLTIAIDEIKRVANLIYEESDRIISLSKSSLELKSNDTISIVASGPTSTTNNVKISAGSPIANTGTVDLVAGDSINHHAKSHKFTDGSGATMIIENGKIHLNPTIPAIFVKQTPELVPAVELFSPEGDVAAPAVKQSYAGVNTIGVNIT